MTMTIRTIVLACITTVAGAILLTACEDQGASDGGRRSSPRRTQPRVSMAAKEAKEVYTSLCATCHGVSGRGDGPGAAALDPKPRSFADVAWQDSVTDTHIQQVVTLGGAAVGKSAAMPAQPQLKGKVEVLNALTWIVRGFRPQ